MDRLSDKVKVGNLTVELRPGSIRDIQEVWDEKGQRLELTPALRKEIQGKLNKVARAHEIAAQLVDQARLDYGDVMTPDEMNDSALTSLVDDEVFCCDNCGWYCSTEELHNEGAQLLCDDCND